MSRLRAGKCVHFNGIQNDACEAGVVYKSLGAGNGRRLPCIEESPIKCDKRCEPTPEQIAASEAEFEEHMARFRLVMAEVAKWKTWTKKNRVAKQEVIECPACKGRLHLSQAAYNGHIWGQCETKGCVSWMQ